MAEEKTFEIKGNAEMFNRFCKPVTPFKISTGAEVIMKITEKKDTTSNENMLLVQLFVNGIEAWRNQIYSTMFILNAMNDLQLAATQQLSEEDWG